MKHIEKLKKFSELQTGGKILWSFIASFAAIEIFSLTRLIVLTVGLKDSLKDTCRIPEISSSSTFQIADCSLPHEMKVYLVVVFVVPLIVVVLTFLKNRDDFVSFVLLVLSYLLLVFPVLLPLGIIIDSQQQNAKNEVSVSSFVKWTSDRYGTKLSHDDALTLLDSRLDSDDKRVKDPTFVKIDGGRKVTLSEDGKNRYYLSVLKDDELSVSKSGKN